MTAQSMMWPDRMNPTDALFWFMDKIPEMRSTIGALVLLERAPTRERLREEFERISHRLPRMRQRVVEVPFTLAPPEWVEDTQFDVDYHLRYLAVPEPGDIGELLSEISPLYATSFDRDRPLWEAYVLEGLTGSRGAVFVKMHHCLTDGVGGSRMFEELLTEHASAGRAPVSPHTGTARSTDTWAVLWRAMLYNLEESAGMTRATVAALLDVAQHPVDTLMGIRRGLRTVTGFGRELAAPPVQSLLEGHRSLSRRLSTFEMALSEIDTVRERLGATNNDIVLTIVSGAMHRWHTSRGSDVRELRAMVPVSIRSTADAQAGNRLALLAVPLPVGEPNPLQRLRAIQERMGQVKSDRRATLYPLLARVMTALPLSVAAQIGRQQTSRTNFVCTNVPGPRRRGAPATSQVSLSRPSIRTPRWSAIIRWQLPSTATATRCSSDSTSIPWQWRTCRTSAMRCRRHTTRF